MHRSKKFKCLSSFFLSGVLGLALLGAPIPVYADHGGPYHAVCVQVYYQSPPGSETHYVVNECRVGTETEWGEVIYTTEPVCRTHDDEINDMHVRHCVYYYVRLPI